MAIKRFCDRCTREIEWGTTGKFRDAWGAHIGLDHDDDKQLKWATFRKELCGDCANEIEAFVMSVPLSAATGD